jgi:hypothetical protein
MQNASCNAAAERIGGRDAGPRETPVLVDVRAVAAMLSALPITADPIFSGLAWALIFGLLASTAFTIFVVPLVDWLLYGRKAVHRRRHGCQWGDRAESCRFARQHRPRRRGRKRAAKSAAEGCGK